MKIPFRKSEKPKPKPKSFKFVVTTDGDVFPYATLELREIFKADANGARDGIIKASDQMDQTDIASSEKLAPKPYNPELFLFMYNNSLHLRACVEQIASDTAGRGYVLQQKEDMPESSEQEDRALEFLENPNPEDSMEDLWLRFLVDRNAYGNAAFEVVRSLDGNIRELWHMNGGKVWRHKDKSTGLFAEKNMKGVNKIKWFLQYNKQDESGNLIQAHKLTGNHGQFDYADRAHEIIFSRCYYLGSSYYGAPPISSGSGDVMIAISARDYNLSFFVNFGIPAMIVTLSGEWTDDSEPDEESIVEIIKRELKDVQGAKKAHNIVVVGVPEGCQLTFEKLNVEVKEGSFKIIRTQITEDILIAYRMPPYRIGWAKTGSLGGNVATEQLDAYISAVVEPHQRIIEKIMRDLFVFGMGITSYEVKLNDLKLWDDEKKAEINANRIRTAQATPNQILREEGKPEFPGGDSYYLESSLIEIGEDDSE